MTEELRYGLDALCEHDALQGVDVFRLEDDPRFVIAVRFRFTEGAVTFITVSDDDTVTTAYDPVERDNAGAWVNVSSQTVWSECIGCTVAWAWAMTNQQGFTDAVRIEFEEPNTHESRIVEFVVMASAFRFFIAREM